MKNVKIILILLACVAGLTSCSKPAPITGEAFQTNMAVKKIGAMEVSIVPDAAVQNLLQSAGAQAAKMRESHAPEEGIDQMYRKELSQIVVASTQTNSEGKFTLTPPSPGRYLLIGGSDWMVWIDTTKSTKPILLNDANAQAHYPDVVEGILKMKI